MISASAPGKLFLFGEYAVLEGHPAMIAAVDRRVVVKAEPSDHFSIYSSLFATQQVTLDIEGPAARVIAGILAAHDLGASTEPLKISVDSAALFKDGRKLGFGSSAAVVVAVAGAVLGKKIAPAELFAACKKRHNEAQGTEGSGGDVAASIMGGLTWLEPGPHLSRMDWTPPLAIVAHPHSASTPAFVSHVKAFKQKDPAAYRRHIDALGAIAQAAKAAAEDRDAALFCEHVAAAEAALAKFGDLSDTSIVTDFHRDLSRKVAAAGGACKPTGAGGGDLSLIAAPTPELLKNVMAAVPEAELLRIGSGLTIYGDDATLTA